MTFSHFILNQTYFSFVIGLVIHIFFVTLQTDCVLHLHNIVTKNYFNEKRKF